MRSSRLDVAVLSVAALGLSLLQAPGAAATGGSRTLDMDIRRNAVVSADGQQAVLRVKARCPAGAELQESFVYVNQDGFSTQFGAVRVPCDGKRHARVVTVTALDFLLHPGRASASGFMSTPEGDSISPVQPLRLRQSHCSHR